MYRPDKYMHRPVGVPYMYGQESRPKRKKMFNFYESSFHTVQPSDLPKVPNRWVSEIKDNFIYYVTERKSPNQPYRHNYDVYDPLRTTIRKFEPRMPMDHSIPLEQVIPPRDRRPQTAPIYEEGQGRYEYVRKSGGERRKKRQKREQQKQQRRRRRSEEIDVEERRETGEQETVDDRRMPPDRKKVFTKAEDTKFHSNKTLEERNAEQRDKAIERLKREAYDGETNVKPTFVLPKGARPEFCNYGFGNINPIREEDYMKTFNVKAGKISELHDYITKRRELTHGYNEWRKYMGSTPTNIQPTGPYKKKKLTRPKTPPRMHQAKQKDYRGVSHYYGGDEQQQQKKKTTKRNRRKIRRKKKHEEEEEEEELEISPRKKGPPKPQPQPQRRKKMKKKRKMKKRVAPSRGNLRKYMDEELEEVMEHGSNVGDEDYYDDDGDDDDDDGEIVVHPRNETGKKLTKILGGKIYSFEPKRFNNEDWNPKNYKHLPNEYTCFIRSAGVRTVRDQDKSVFQAMKQFD